jgi:opacity protein-like surface antigen
MCEPRFPSINSTVANILPATRSAAACVGVAAALMLPSTVAAGPAASPVPAPTAKPWTFATSVGGKTGYDSNVMLQDLGDQAHREAWVNSLSALFAATYQPNPLFKAVFSYAPEAVFYEGESTENHITHRGALNLSGKSGDTTWELLNGVTLIDGSDLGPRYTQNGGTLPADLPAVGGVPVRDRRDAAVYKNSFKLTKTWDRIFVRPVASFYHHTFMTEQHAPVGPYLGYENYIDRQELNGGFDFGYEAWDKAWLVAGVRVGQQKQDERLGVPSPYDNSYYRILAGIEGTPVEWLKLNLLAGPDFRDYDSATPVGYDEDLTYYFVDASATIIPTKIDTITLSAKRFLQPSFTSPSMYEDIAYEATWRRVVDSRFTVGTGFRAYHADWRPPTPRDEWVFTPVVSLAYTHSANLSADLAYSYDWAYSQLPNTTARDYTRHLVWLGLKYTF